MIRAMLWKEWREQRTVALSVLSFAALALYLTALAALQMELLGHDFYLFMLADSGRCAVVYRRRDGNLGLIEASS